MLFSDYRECPLLPLAQQEENFFIAQVMALELCFSNGKGRAPYVQAMEFVDTGKK